jgi:YidC/Oxa1 family membrane protein insertase
MNQTRTFLLFALLAVAYMLFLAWQKDYAPVPPPTVATTTAAPSSDASVPGAIPTAATPIAAAPAAAGSISRCRPMC